MTEHRLTHAEALEHYLSQLEQLRRELAAEIREEERDAETVGHLSMPGGTP